VSKVPLILRVILRQALLITEQRRLYQRFKRVTPLSQDGKRAYKEMTS
jgi:hypothetical protein